jgi:8-oxo-dGTP diphosphatase
VFAITAYLQPLCYTYRRQTHPDGQAMHTDQRYPVPAVGAIILRGDEILLIKRGAEPALGKWSIPGGSVEIGETLREAVRREVKEETNLDVEVGKLAGITDLIVEKEGILTWHYVLINYFATATEGDPVAATDVSECRWVKLSDLGDYDVTKTLIDRLTELKLIP